MITGAKISPCGLYRYFLLRKWDATLPICLFIMLNPSTADAEQDDPTIRRCMDFARREGCGSLEVVNLFAFRATSPVDMKDAIDPVGPENDGYTSAAIMRCTGPIIAAWGTHGSFMDRDKVVTEFVIDPWWKLLEPSPKPLMCLGSTKDGHPKHPLYLRKDAPLTLYSEKIQ